ncbi:MAG: zinc ribbon domain-containing protein [Pseudomonadota bacterium]
MPIYEFQCLDCGKEFEELILGSNVQVSCKHCQSSKVEKLMSAVSFKSSGKFTSSAGSPGCSSCSGTSCSTCK